RRAIQHRLPFGFGEAAHAEVHAANYESASIDLTALLGILALVTSLSFAYLLIVLAVVVNLSRAVFLGYLAAVPFTTQRGPTVSMPAHCLSVTVTERPLQAGGLHLGVFLSRPH